MTNESSVLILDLPTPTLQSFYTRFLGCTGLLSTSIHDALISLNYKIICDMKTLGQYMYLVTKVIYQFIKLLWAIA